MSGGSSSSSLAGLGPLLDGAALAGVALQLIKARRRLHSRTGGALPTACELALGLRMYIGHCDERRITDAAARDAQADIADLAEVAEGEPAAERPLANRVAQLDLRELLRLADLAYVTDAELHAHSACAPRFHVLSGRWEAEKWAPAYFVAYFPDTRVLLLSVRGSKETSDFLTNLSCETVPFLEDYGHRGVVQSAQGIYDALAPILEAHVAVHDVARFDVVGHSLGGAVATALALMFRSAGAAPGDCGKNVLHRARAVAFGPPPFLSRRLAERASDMGVVTVVCGLDLVPRLSAASLDRFLFAVAKHEWSQQVGSTIERAAALFVSPQNAARVSSLLAQRGGAGAAWAVSALDASARRALETHRQSGNRSALWEGLLTAGLFTSNIVSNQFLGGQDYTLNGDVGAKQFGKSGDDVERMLVEDAPPEMFLAGEILHFDIPFLSPEEFAQGRGFEKCTVRRSTMDEFLDVEASAWMLHNHKLDVLLYQFDKMLDGL